jgi:hypothetical protein
MPISTKSITVGREEERKTQFMNELKGILDAGELKTMLKGVPNADEFEKGLRELLDADKLWEALKALPPANQDWLIGFISEALNTPYLRPDGSPIKEEFKEDLKIFSECTWEASQRAANSAFLRDVLAAADAAPEVVLSRELDVEQEAASKAAYRMALHEGRVAALDVAETMYYVVFNIAAAEGEAALGSAALEVALDAALAAKSVAEQLIVRNPKDKDKYEELDLDRHFKNVLKLWEPVRVGGGISGVFNGKVYAFVPISARLRREGPDEEPDKPGFS